MFLTTCKILALWEDICKKTNQRLSLVNFFLIFSLWGKKEVVCSFIKENFYRMQFLNVGTFTDFCFCGKTQFFSVYWFQHDQNDKFFTSTFFRFLKKVNHTRHFFVTRTLKYRPVWVFRPYEMVKSPLKREQIVSENVFL